MRAEDLRGYLDQRPFHPFRMHLSSGVSFEIRQPELVTVSHSTITIGLPLESGSQHFVVAALVHVVWLDIVVPAP